MTDEKGPALRKRIPPTERRNMIMDAAVDSFLKKGLRGTTMQDIARSCGISIGHIYNHFDSKDSIVESIISRGLQDFLESAIKSWKPSTTTAETSECVARELSRRSGRLMQIQLEILTEAMRNERVRKCLLRASKKARKSIVEAVGKNSGEESEAIPPSLEQRVSLALAMLDGIAMRQAVSGSKTSSSDTFLFSKAIIAVRNADQDHA